MQHTSTYQSILCPDRKCLTYLCVESSQHTHSPRTPCCSRTKKGDFRPPQPRGTLGRGQRGRGTPYRKYWLQYVWKTGNMVTLEDKLDCGRLGVVTTCCCPDNLKMLINDKKVINQSHGQRAHPSNPSKIVLFVYQITDLEMFHFSLPTIQSPLINKYFRDYKYSNCL